MASMPRSSRMLAQLALELEGVYLCGAGTRPGAGVRAQRRRADPQRPRAIRAATEATALDGLVPP